MDSSVFFEGSIDDVRVYNTRLNDNNIEWIYYNGSAQSLNPVSSGAQLTTGNGSDTYDEFQLEIPYIGEVFDADLTLKIESEETPWGNSSAIGTIEVELFKDELNCSVEDATLIDTSHYIYDGWDFSKQHNLELSDYLANGSISEYYGTYILRIEVTDTNFSQNYNFTLSEFSIETDTWIQADGLENYKAWVTDPAKWDTDGDGWGDYYEIFQKGTNPYSVDTDADGIWDPNDIDPFKDLLIEIKFISGRHRNIYYWQGDPDMEGYVEFELMGLEMFFVTELKKATCDPNTALLQNPNQKCYFGHKYYINPPDDHKSLDLRFELWQISPTADDGSRMGDLRLVKADYEYDLNYEGYPPKYKTFESEGTFGHDNELEVRIKTLSMERANTIAIYEANSTFVGHYQEQEKMNVIQLWVTDDGTGTPFQKGPNAIVVSTSLFGNTKLHSMLEKEQLQQTPLWSPIAGDYQFIAVDRDKNSKSDGASNNVDFVIIRRAISSAQAMDVLDLLMTCYVNESLDEATNLTVYEEAKLYTYASTKINGTKAVKMNLHVDVLGYVPYFSEYKNSEQGQEPNNKSKFTATFILVVAGMIAAIVVCAVLAVYSGGGTALVMIGLICMLIYMLDAYLPGIAEILTMITAFMIELVMTILTWLGPLAWLILRAVMLVLIWAIFAINLAMVIIEFSAIIAIIPILCLLMDIDVSIQVDKIKIQNQNVDIEFGYEISELYYEFFDFYIPLINIYIDKGSTKLEFPYYYFLSCLAFPNHVFSESDDFFDINGSSSQSSGLKSSGDLREFTENEYIDFLTGMGLTMGAFSILMGWMGTSKSLIIDVASILICLNSIFGFISFVLGDRGSGLNSLIFYGAAFGCIISWVFARFVYAFKGDNSDLVNEIIFIILAISMFLSVPLSILDISISLLGLLFFPIFNNAFFCTIQFIIGIIGLIGASAILMFGNEESEAKPKAKRISRIALLTFGLCFFIGLMMDCV